jgi:hypothetical protein
MAGEKAYGVFSLGVELYELSSTMDDLSADTNPTENRLGFGDSVEATRIRRKLAKREAGVERRKLKKGP